MGCNSRTAKCCQTCKHASKLIEYDYEPESSDGPYEYLRCNIHKEPYIVVGTRSMWVCDDWIMYHRLDENGWQNL